MAQAIAALRVLLAELDASRSGVTPWRAQPAARSAPDLRISATDQLSWWFRPANAGAEPWDAYFSTGSDDDELEEAGRPPAQWWDTTPVARPARRRPSAAPPHSRAGLRELLAEPEEELIDADADAVVTRLYDFVHALGRNDVDGAMGCVADDYHAVEDDREIDRAGLARQLRILLDSLHGWEKDVFLVEVPRPVLHPAAILVHVELQINARHRVTHERRTIVDRRVAVFSRAGDGGWRILSLSAV